MNEGYNINDIPGGQQGYDDEYGGYPPEDNYGQQGYDDYNEGYDDYNEGYDDYGEEYGDYNDDYGNYDEGYEEYDEYGDYGEGYEDYSESAPLQYDSQGNLVDETGLMYDEEGYPLYDEYGQPIYSEFFNPYEGGTNSPKTNRVKDKKNIMKYVIIGIVVLMIVFLGKKFLGDSGKDDLAGDLLYHVTDDGLPMNSKGEFIEIALDENGEVIGIPVHEDKIDEYGEVYYPDLQQEVNVGVLDEWDEEQKELEEIEKKIEELEPVMVTKIDEKFFEPNPDLSKIQETPFRDLDIELDFESTNPFIVYNYQKDLEPYSRDSGYINRELLGRILNYELFTEVFLYKADKNLQRYSETEPPARIANDFNRERAKEIIREKIDEVREMEIYPDFEIYKTDVVVNKVLTLLDKNVYTSEESLKFYSRDMEFIKDRPEERFLYDLQQEIVNKIELLPNQTLSNTELGKIMFKIMKEEVKIQLNNYKQVACAELNEYNPGLCTEFTDISTLELKSDFIEDIYVKAFSKSVEKFYHLMYNVYNDIVGINDDGDIIVID